MLYRALTLLYNKDMIESIDPETGALVLVEAGYVHPGQTIDLEGERAEILLGLGYIEPAPPEVAPEPALELPAATESDESPTPRKRRA